VKRMTPELGDWLNAEFGDNTVVDRLPGDVSGRLFWRVFSSRETFVVMDSGRTPLWPWLDIHGLLEGKGFPVPKIIASKAANGWVIQEDLGESRLVDAEEPHYTELLGRALNLLLRMQRELSVEVCSASVAGRRSFTPIFFMAEMEQTLECLFFRLLDVGQEDLLCLQRDMRELCGMIDGSSVFTHRDYHSANLMVRDGALFMVDWQDARFGPAEYDLASLLRDSYRDPGAVWVEMARKFITSRGDLNMFGLAKVACQRSLKAAGTFALQYRVTGDRKYLGYLPRTMRYLGEYSGLCPQLGRLVGNVFRVLDTCTGEVDLRDFRDSDRPTITETYTGRSK
jgi:N-acetylmuramate 1-kinase